jgi:U3 small nucleolar RNA-associated protein 4
MLHAAVGSIVHARCPQLCSRCPLLPHRFQKEHPSRLTKCPQRPIMQIAGVAGGSRAAATQQPLLMAAQRNVLDIWQLAAAADKASPDEPRPDGTQAEGDPLDLVAAPAHVARIKTAGGLHITCGAIAPSGSHVVVSDAGKVRAFALQQEEAEAGAGQQLQVSSIKISSVVPAATCMVFGSSSSSGSGKAGSSSSSELLYCADAAGTIRAVDLQQAEVVAEAEFSSRQDGTSSASSSGTSVFGPEVSLMVVSPDGSLLAAAGRSSLRLFKLPGLQHHGDLLLQSQPGRATAAQFTGDSKQLAVISSGTSLEVYDVQRLAPTEWSLSNSSVVQHYVDKLPGSVAGLAASTSTSKHEVIVYTHGGMSHFDLNAPLTNEELSKKRQRQKQRPQEADMAYCSPGQNGRVLPLPEYPCLFASYLAADAVLLVEQPWEQVLQKLPAPLYRHRYGS